MVKHCEDNGSAFGDVSLSATTQLFTQHLSSGPTERNKGRELGLTLAVDLRGVTLTC